MFGRIQRSVSKLNQVAFELGVSIINGNADTYGEMLNRLRRTGEKFGMFHRPAQALGHITGPAFRGFRKNNHKFLPTVAGNRVYFAHVLHENGSYIAQHLIACMMAEGVIELLEMVNINHQQRKLLASALGPLE